MTTAEISTDIVSLVEASPVLVLTDKDRFSQFYEAMRRECDAHEPDLSTDKGRKEIASLAYKVARTKTAIDDAGKKLNEQARAQISAVDESRREIRKQLDDLKDEVRRPLTEWEDAEKQREQDVAEELKLLAKNVGRISGTSKIKSLLSKARKELKKKKVKIDKVFKYYDAAFEEYQNQLKWMLEARATVYPAFGGYLASIADTLGARQQDKLPRSTALFITACTADHRDISLNF